MRSLGLLVCLGPYQYENPETLIEVANAALDKGIEVRIFCFMDAVYNTRIGQETKSIGIESVESRFKKLIDRGAEVTLCGFCLMVRGGDITEGKDSVEGTVIGGTIDMAEMIEASDRFLMI